MKALGLCLLCCVSLLPGGAWAESRVLKGRVVQEGDHGELTGVGQVTVVLRETDAHTVTVSNGHFRLPLDENFQPGETVHLDLQAPPNLRLLSPPTGEFNVPLNLDKQIIEVRVLPVGSKRTPSGERIEKYFKGKTSEARSRAIRTGAVAPVDVALLIRDWAVKNGYSAEQAQTEVDAWVAEVEKRGENAEQLALAAFLKSDFKRAREMLNGLASKTDQQLEKRLGELAVLKEKVVRQHEAAGEADYNAGDYKGALSNYDIALQHLSKEKERNHWVLLMLSKAVAHVAQGEIDQGEAISQHFEQARATYDQLLDTYTRRDMPREWARIQISFGNALRSQGERADKDAAVTLLNASMQAYRDALQVYTLEDVPQKWALAQNQLGNALLRQGERAEGTVAIRLLKNAVEAFRTVLQVRTHAQWPEEWAMTQSNLADALVRLSAQEGVVGSDGMRQEAVEACRAALEVRTREKWPQEWAVTQNLLGNALLAQGERSLSEESARVLIQQAVEAYRAALAERPQTQRPQLWAMTQSNLGNALRGLGNRTLDPRVARGLLGQAIEVNRAALEVLTLDQVPHFWAITQNNLGNALLSQTPLVSEAQSILLLNEAINAYQAALKVFGSEQTSLYWHPTHVSLMTARWVMVEMSVLAGTPLEREQAFRGIALERGENSKTFSNLRTLELLSLLLSRRPETVPARVEEFQTLFLNDSTAEGKSWFRPYKLKDLVYDDPRLAPYRSWLPFLVEAVNGGNRKDILSALNQARTKLSR